MNKKIRIITILAFLIVLFTVYNIKHYRAKTLYPNNREKRHITVERISNAPKQITPVREINYFETDKDIFNWLVRSDEKNGIVVKHSQKYVTQGAYSVQVNWKTSEWAELVLLHFPRDWQHYKYFIFDIFNPNDAGVNFEIKIGDRFDASNFYPKANKFILKGTLKTGLNTFRLKIDEIKNKIDITSERKIIHLRFFDKNKSFYLDNMRLEI